MRRSRRLSGISCTFWSRQGEQHFVIEERLVLPALADDDAEWAEATRRVREEHGEIRAGAASLARGSVGSRARAGWASC